MSVSMEKWGVTETGFYRPTIDEIIKVKNTLAKGEFGEDFDTDSKTIQGKMFQINAAAQSKLMEIAEGVYYSIFPHTATGVSLDRVCENVALQREGASYAQHILRVYGTQDYVIEAGTEFQNDAGVGFYSVMTATINQEKKADEDTVIYFADVEVQCKESGTIGNVTNINSTIEVDNNIDSVTWLKTIAYGAETETDPELRERRDTVAQGIGANTETAIISNVLRVSGVNDVIIINNKTAESVVISDNLTVEPNSYAVVVYSDDTTIDDLIGEAIRQKEPLGITQSGTVSVDVKDDAGVTHTVKFTYVEAEKINVSVECTVDRTFETTGEQDIEANITSYINSLGIGEEVIYSRLYKSLYKVTGVYEVTNMTINGETTNIPIDKISIAKVGEINIDITEV